MSVVAVYGGTFDPVTNGHLDVVRRAARLFGSVRVLVSRGGRETLFPPEERVALLVAAAKGTSGVEVEAFEGLLVERALALGARVLVRGIRGARDVEVELPMAFANEDLAPGLSTVFLAPSRQNAFISSTLVREVAGLGGDVSAWVPAVVLEALRSR